MTKHKVTRGSTLENVNNSPGHFQEGIRPPSNRALVIALLIILGLISLAGWLTL